MAAVWSWAGRFSGRPQSGTRARVTTRLSWCEPWAGAGARGLSRCSSRHRDWAKPASVSAGPGWIRSRAFGGGSAAERRAQVSLGH